MLRDIKNKLVIKTNPSDIITFGYPYFDKELEWLRICTYNIRTKEYIDYKPSSNRQDYNNNIDMEIYPISSRSIMFAYRWCFDLTEYIQPNQELCLIVFINMKQMLETLIADKWNLFKNALGCDPFGADIGENNGWYCSLTYSSCLFKSAWGNIYNVIPGTVVKHGNSPDILEYQFPLSQLIKATSNFYVMGSNPIYLRGLQIPNYIVYSTEKKLHSFYLKAKRFLYNLVQKLTYFNYLPSNI